MEIIGRDLSWHWHWPVGTAENQNKPSSCWTVFGQYWAWVTLECESRELPCYSTLLGCAHGTLHIYLTIVLV
jgi:hypothetical protein